MLRRFVFLLFLIVSSSFVCPGSVSSNEPAGAKNVILMIGDGMGFNSDIAGTYWRYGKDNAQSYHQFPRALACTTFSIKSNGFDFKKNKGYTPEIFWSGMKGGQESSSKAVVTDSAASGSAINSGQKTLNGRIGMTFNATPLKMYAEYAAQAGRSVGVVTTVMASHATPASVMAHQPSRGDYKKIFREMILDQPIQVLFGGGNPDYTDGLPNEDGAQKNYNYVGGKEIWEQLIQKNGFAGLTFIDQKDEFEHYAAMTPGGERNIPARVVGIARSMVIPPIDGASDEAGMQQVRKSIKKDAFEQLPTLSTMSCAALNILSSNKKGFYLMIEGGAIDWANHANRIDLMVLQHTGFSKAIDAVIDWVERYSSWEETLLIITADHETGQLWGPRTWTPQRDRKEVKEGETFNTIAIDSVEKKSLHYSAQDKFNQFEPIKNCGKSVVPEGQYATGGHSNGLVPFWVKGARVELIDSFIRGRDEKAGCFWKFSGDYIDNTDITPFMLKASGLAGKK